MTNKQAAFARALAEGFDIKDAAKVAGYNLPYARKKAREPAVKALVERFRAREEREQRDRDAVGRLWETIDDPASSAQERTGAIRALIAYERAHQDDQQRREPVQIIDDIPPMCEKCPFAGKDFAGDENGTDGNQGPGRDDGEGCATASGPAPDAAAT